MKIRITKIYAILILLATLIGLALPALAQSLKYGQWLGGKGGAGQIKAAVYQNAAVNNCDVTDCIVAGGFVGAGGNINIGITMNGSYGGASDGFVIEVADGGTPSLIWGQWLGGTSNDQVYALAINGSSIYVGGYVAATTAMQTVTFQGPHGGAQEGYVIKITDGGTPTLNWGQWLGGNGTDQVNALSINGSSIYVGGVVTTTTAMQSVTFQGPPGGNTEGFVVKITDGGTPTLNWGQWLGGISSDLVYALSINGSSIYVGGTVNATTAMQAVTFQGPPGGGTDAFVVKITDGGTPTLNWGQWLGGTANENSAVSLVINGSSIYAGGYVGATTAMQSVTFQGPHGGGQDGFVVKIMDGGTPTLNWGQWLGGNGTDAVNALALSGSKIYAGGSIATTSGSQSVTFPNTVANGGTAGFLIEITDGGTPTLTWGQWAPAGGQAENAVVLTAVASSSSVIAGGYAAQPLGFESVTFQGPYGGGVSDGFVVDITDGGTPTLKWGQWLGGTSGDRLYALAINGSSIYAGGYVQVTTGMQSVTFQGLPGGGLEGYVIKITDGGTPTLNWGQWLGGTGGDQVSALVINGSSVYAGGYVSETTAMQSVTFQGPPGGGIEGYVVKITDGGTPTLNWGQWLGGTSTDNVNAVVINGSSVYAGGYVALTTAMQSVTFQGLPGGGNEGYVVKITDGGTPTLNWGQWLGGNGSDRVQALALYGSNGNNIYAGGFIPQTSGMQSITFQGTMASGNEGYVVKIFDPATASTSGVIFFDTGF